MFGLFGILPKTNMELKNEGFEDDAPLLKGGCSGSMLVLKGVFGIIWMFQELD